MTQLQKIPIFLLLIVLAAVLAAIFGALHNQISYTTGPSYFTEFKFRQFAIPDTMAPRLGAALVGIRASWWMGVLVGLPALVYGLLMVPRPRSYLAAGLTAICLVVSIAFFAAIAGLIGGMIAAESSLLDSYLTLPEGPDRAEFVRAGFMQDASYLGGALGALAAFWPMRVARGNDLSHGKAP